MHIKLKCNLQCTTKTTATTIILSDSTICLKYLSAVQTISCNLYVYVKDTNEKEKAFAKYTNNSKRSLRIKSVGLRFDLRVEGGLVKLYNQLVNTLAIPKSVLTKYARSSSHSS